MIKQYLKQNLVYFLPAVFFAALYAVGEPFYQALQLEMTGDCTKVCAECTLLFKAIFVACCLFFALAASLLVGWLINSQRKFKIMLKSGIGGLFILIYICSYLLTERLASSTASAASTGQLGGLVVFMLVTPSCWGTLFLLTILRFLFTERKKRLSEETV